MNDTELVSALRNLKINTKGLACLGCNYGFQCSEKGCRLIGLAADRLSEYGNTRAIRRNIAREQNVDPSNFTIDAFVNSMKAVQPRKRITDFERCADTSELAVTLRCIDDNGYSFCGATQDDGVYTVFFHRPALE